jgi:hypothetical protein
VLSLFVDALHILGVLFSSSFSSLLLILPHPHPSSPPNHVHKLWGGGQQVCLLPLLAIHLRRWKNSSLLPRETPQNKVYKLKNWILFAYG